MTALLASTVLDRAADQIAKTGLGKGAFRQGYGTAPEDGQYCTVGAIRFAAGWYDDEFTDLTVSAVDAARRCVEDLLDWTEDGIFDWSDAPTTTAEMVVDVLRHAASVARLDEEAA